jgi:hypothetical protein
MYTLSLGYISVDICHLDSTVTLRHDRIMTLDSIVTARSSSLQMIKDMPKRQVTLCHA